jgi:hypothetical protein
LKKIKRNKLLKKLNLKLTKGQEMGSLISFEP